MIQMQTDSIWKRFQNHQHTLWRRNQREGTFIWDKSLPLVLLCLCLWGENGDYGKCHTRISVFRMAFILVQPLSTEPWNSFTDTPSHSMFSTTWHFPQSVLFHLADTCFQILCFCLPNALESHINNRGHPQGELRGEWQPLRLPVFPFSVLIPPPSSPLSGVPPDIYLLLDSGALMFFLFSFPVYISLRINGILILKSQ